MISAQAAQSIRDRLAQVELVRKGYDPRSGGSEEEFRQLTRMVRKPTNDELGALEEYNFFHSKPEHLFAYYDGDARIGQHVKTWTGNVLGTIIWRGVERRPMGGKVVAIRVRGINGIEYAGNCNLSSGTYCRLKRMKGR